MTKEIHETSQTYPEGWYQWFKLPAATTHIAHVSESGGIYLPEDGVSYADFHKAYQAGGAYLLVLDETVREERRIQIAKTCHESNRVLQGLNGEEVGPAWDDAPYSIRESAHYGVGKALAGATPEELHISWVNFKIDDGWVYGPVKDDVKKTHHCLVSYDELPEEQRSKDHMFQAIVKSFIG